MAGFFSGLRARLSQATNERPGEMHSVRGFPVLVENTRPDIATEDVLQRLDDALVLIEEYQPIRFAHLRRDLRRIWVVRFACRGAYFPADQTCMTELTFLARRDIPASVVASSILHEGVHARVDRFRAHFGGGHDQSGLAREERLCRRAELVFGQSLPESLGAPVIERALATMSLDDAGVAPSIDWNVAQARQQAVDAAARRSR
jgi:hypothetical protein